MACERKVSMKITGLSRKDLLIAILRARRSFGSLLPGLETLGPGIRAAVARARLDPAYKDIPDEEWQQIGMELSDPRYYYIAGCGHTTPSDSELEKHVRGLADSLLQKKPR